MKSLNSVWCASCREPRGISGISGKLEKGLLVSKDIGTHCGRRVAQAIENEQD